MTANYRPTLTADEAAGDADLHGKTAVITGASAGLGIETARVLAEHGARIVSAVRDVDKGRRAAAEIRKAVPNADIEFAEVDLCDLDSVRKGADDIAARFPKIDLLINNAGVMFHPLGRTKEGLDIHLGANHLGHFVLTARLVDCLIAAAPARIINLTSLGHQQGPFRLDDPLFERDPYDKVLAYAQSKTANILFSVALDRRFKDRGVRALAVNPGLIPGTDLTRYLGAEELEQMTQSAIPEHLVFKTVSQGTSSTIWAAVAPELEGIGGVYIDDAAIADVIEPTVAPGQVEQGVLSYALDEKIAERLWSLSEEWSREVFPA